MRRVLQDAEVLHGDSLEVRVGRHPLENLGLGVGFHGLAVLPDVRSAIGVRLGVCQPLLRDEAWHGSDGGGHRFGYLAVVLLAGALEAKGDDLDLHSAYPSFSVVSRPSPQL